MCDHLRNKCDSEADQFIFKVSNRICYKTFIYGKARYSTIKLDCLCFDFILLFQYHH